MKGFPAVQVILCFVNVIIQLPILCVLWILGCENPLAHVIKAYENMIFYTD